MHEAYVFRLSNSVLDEGADRVSDVYHLRIIPPLFLGGLKVMLTLYHFCPNERHSFFVGCFLRFLISHIRFLLHSSRPVFVMPLKSKLRYRASKTSPSYTWRNSFFFSVCVAVVLGLSVSHQLSGLLTFQPTKPPSEYQCLCVPDNNSQVFATRPCAISPVEADYGLQSWLPNTYFLMAYIRFLQNYPRINSWELVTLGFIRCTDVYYSIPRRPQAALECRRGLMFVGTKHLNRTRTTGPMSGTCVLSGSVRSFLLLFPGSSVQHVGLWPWLPWVGRVDRLGWIEVILPPSTHDLWLWMWRAWEKWKENVKTLWAWPGIMHISFPINSMTHKKSICIKKLTWKIHNYAWLRTDRRPHMWGGVLREVKRNCGVRWVLKRSL